MQFSSLLVCNCFLLACRYILSHVLDVKDFIMSVMLGTGWLNMWSARECCGPVTGANITELESRWPWWLEGDSTVLAIPGVLIAHQCCSCTCWPAANNLIAMLLQLEWMNRWEMWLPTSWYGLEDAASSSRSSRGMAMGVWNLMCVMTAKGRGPACWHHASLMGLRYAVYLGGSLSKEVWAVVLEQLRCCHKPAEAASHIHG